jgi:hypothetical protein
MVRIMCIIFLSKYFVYPRRPSLICDVDYSLRLVRSLLNSQYNVSGSLQTIIYIFSVFDLPRSDLRRDLRKKCGAVLLLEAVDDKPMHTNRSTDNLEEVLERREDQEMVIERREII